MSQEREEITFLIKLCEQTERFEDMRENVRKLMEIAKTNPDSKPKPKKKEDKEEPQEDEKDILTLEERNLLSVAYKNSVGTRRTAFRIISSVQHKEDQKDNDARKEDLKDFKKKLEAEMDEICDEILAYLDGDLIKDSCEVETRVFYLKMKADYYRYQAEYAEGDKKEKVKNGAKDAYEQATALAEGLSTTSPIRLGLALNFSVFYYETMQDNKKACELAKNAFDDAIGDIETIKESEYKDATVIMQLIRDNLTLWNSEMEEDADDDN